MTFISYSWDSFFYKYNRYSLIALVERKNIGIYNKIISYKGDKIRIYKFLALKNVTIQKKQKDFLKKEELNINL